MTIAHSDSLRRGFTPLHGAPSTRLEDRRAIEQIRSPVPEKTGNKESVPHSCKQTSWQSFEQPQEQDMEDDKPSSRTTNKLWAYLQMFMQNPTRHLSVFSNACSITVVITENARPVSRGFKQGIGPPYEARKDGRKVSLRHCQSRLEYV